LAKRIKLIGKSILPRTFDSFVSDKSNKLIDTSVVKVEFI